LDEVDHHPFSFLLDLKPSAFACNVHYGSMDMGLIWHFAQS